MTNLFRQTETYAELLVENQEAYERLFAPPARPGKSTSPVRSTPTFLYSLGAGYASWSTRDGASLRSRG